MTAGSFLRQYQSDPAMTRRCKVVVVETSPEGYLLARAESPYGVAYCASRTSSKAIGRACSAAAFGDFASAEAFETPDEALAYVRTTPVDYH